MTGALSWINGVRRRLSPIAKPKSAVDAPVTPYRAPLFLLAPPDDGCVPMQFGPPSLSRPVSQLCTQAQLDEPAYAAWCRSLGLAPAVHRKHWEYAYTLAALDAAGAIVPAHRALTFAVGNERTPAYLASRGLAVVATDAPPDIIKGLSWETTGQYTRERSQLFYEELVARDVFDRLVSYRPVDMNHIPDDLRGFDLCWSSCSMEHLGAFRRGLDFVVRAMETLKPGGVAVHTTEFNMTSNDQTIDTRWLSLYRKRDIEDLMARLVQAGHEVWPLNLHPGSGPADAYVDPWPYQPEPHLKLQIEGFTCTSIGLVIRKRPDPQPATALRDVAVLDAPRPAGVTALDAPGSAEPVRSASRAAPVRPA